MVVKMMRWRPWPPLLCKKFEVRLIVRSFEGGFDLVDEGADKENIFAVEIRWKGPKIALSPFRRTVKRNFTREEHAVKWPNAVVRWDEEFQTVCSLSGYKDNDFHPWEITFTVFNGPNVGSKSRAPVIGIASLNLAEYASATEQREFELTIPLAVSGSAADLHPSLCLFLSLVELRTVQKQIESVQRSIFPIPSSPQVVENSSTEKDELSAIKAGLKKVRLLTDYVSARRAKKACHEGSEGRCSARSEEGNHTYHFDSDSLDDFDGKESEEGKEDSSVRKSFSYGTLAYANCAGRSHYSNISINGEDENWIYYSNRKSDVGCSKKADSAASVSIPYASQNLKHSILRWRKRKSGFRSPKAKGEPLLKKDYGEEGGDDIDFDRRQLSSDESLSFWWQKSDEDSSANRSSVSDFGDDNFAVGTWEQKELTSRDGHMKLRTEVFFASIDQRNERAAGESACTALVAVVADWLQNNRDLMPIKSQFDSLIREGSLEWRNLCENETYRELFTDKHFDLETVLQAEIRSLAVIPGKSFIGFFHPDGMEEGRFAFLHGAMSFDSIWDEISHAASEYQSSCESQVYIVSWNDHFFILKVDHEAYYIIDTLGERLFEGCSQAYILKFDRDTAIYKLPSTSQSSEDKPACNQPASPAAMVTKNQQSQQKNRREESAEGSTVTEPEASNKSGAEEELVCQGKESCKEYIKSFLAAIPIRELQADIKRGLISSTPLHHRLQIEFHYTQIEQKVPTPLTMEISPPLPHMMPQMAEVAITEISA